MFFQNKHDNAKPTVTELDVSLVFLATQDNSSENKQGRQHQKQNWERSFKITTRHASPDRWQIFR